MTLCLADVPGDIRDPAVAGVRIGERGQEARGGAPSLSSQGELLPDLRHDLSEIPVLSHAALYAPRHRSRQLRMENGGTTPSS